MSSKSSLVVVNSFDRNCKRHHIRVSNMKYVDPARWRGINASYSFRWNILTHSSKVKRRHSLTHSNWHDDCFSRFRWFGLCSWPYKYRLLVSEYLCFCSSDERKSKIPRQSRVCVSSRYLYTLDKTSVRSKSDQTLEVIMTDLDPEIMKNFYREYTSSAAEATKVRSIDTLNRANND